MRKTLEAAQEEYKDAGVDCKRDIELELAEYESAGGSSSESIFDVVGGDPNMDYYWGAETVYNEEIPGWEYALIRDHWTRARASDLPEMALRCSNNSFKGSTSGDIKNRGLILYQRDKRFGAIDERKKLEVERDLRRSMNYMNADFDSRYKSRVDKCETTRGNPFQ